MICKIVIVQEKEKVMKIIKNKYNFKINFYGGTNGKI